MTRMNVACIHVRFNAKLMLCNDGRDLNGSCHFLRQQNHITSTYKDSFGLHQRLKTCLYCFKDFGNYSKYSKDDLPRKKKWSLDSLISYYEHVLYYILP